MDELLQILAVHAYQYRENPPFILASGQTSNEYIDCRRALSYPFALVKLGKIITEKLHKDIVAVGGMTMGADPISMSTSFTSPALNRYIKWFSIRKEAKMYGRERLIEGGIEPEDTVAVVDDVVTSGQSTIKAIRACRKFELKVAQVIVLIDRQQMNGLQNIKDEVGPEVPVEAIFTIEQIRNKKWKMVQ